VMRKALENYQGGISIGGRRITNLRYADDIVLLAASVQELQDLVNRIAEVGKDYSLLINASKTKTMALNDEHFRLNIDGNQIEQVSTFPYLGSLITDDATCTQEIKHRLNLGSAAMSKMKSLWGSHTLSLNSKIRLCKALVWSTATYGCESWTIKKGEEKKLQAFEMKMIRRLLGVSWQEHRTNALILEEIGCVRTFLSSIKKRKLTYAGHVARATTSLEKTIMQGRVPGKRGRGRPRRSWMDDITDWTSLSLADVERTARNRTEWQRLVRNAAKP